MTVVRNAKIIYIGIFMPYVLWFMVGRISQIYCRVVGMVIDNIAFSTD